MTDHFSVIGFNAGSAEELAEMVSKLPDTGAYSQPCAPGYYYRWHSDSGSELWVHLAAGGGDEKLDIVGVTPYFSGSGRVPVRVMKKRQRPTDNAFEGAVFVEIEPGPRPRQCSTVALLDVVDYAVWANRVTPFMAVAQIAAFPHDLMVFPDEDAFARAQIGQTVQFTPESFFASGLFSSGEAGSAAVFHDPSADEFTAASRAFFAGRVLSVEQRRNSVTGQVFHAAQVKILGGTVDVVADTRQLRGELAPGCVIQGEFWLCARLIEGSGHA
ncbi:MULTISPECIES: hypothetical protein [Rhodomicrobium]|uniref:hypothetical protein n=1 Tax=Rhodomicrobium TaxID=1068 RepID=UPI000B4B93BB|nr:MULTISPECIES: hypothetical protein [Rhodomicrobium]